MLKLMMLNSDGTVAVSDFTAADAELLLKPLVAASMDPVAVALLVMVLGRPLKTPAFTLTRVGDAYNDDEMPVWAHQQFMLRPKLWPGGCCALAKHDQPLAERELAYLTHQGDQIHFSVGNVVLRDAQESRALSSAEVLALYDDGWRVD